METVFIIGGAVLVIGLVGMAIYISDKDINKKLEEYCNTTNTPPNTKTGMKNHLHSTAASKKSKPRRDRNNIDDSDTDLSSMVISSSLVDTLPLYSTSPPVDSCSGSSYSSSSSDYSSSGSSSSSYDSGSSFSGGCD